MFDVNYVVPGDSVSWLVKQFESVRSTGAMVLEDKYIPRIDVGFVFHFDAIPYITSPREVRLKSYFLAPVLKQANTMRVDGPLDTFIATCHPTIVSRLFGLDFSKGSKLYIDLPGSVFTPLWEALKSKSHIQEKADTFTRFIQNVNPDEYLHDEVDRCYFRIIEHCRDVPMPELLSSPYASVSTIQRQFHKRLGVSAKILARIARLNHIWNQIIADPSASYQDLVFFGNYFDQAHFINDFKNLTGETPGMFFSRNIEVSKMLSGR